jgi:uncharacterized protein Yka (UPF0111/DUF47 family)
MSGFQHPASDHGSERRSLGLDDLPTIRDARGEPVARTEDSRADNRPSSPPAPVDPVPSASEKSTPAPASVEENPPASPTTTWAASAVELPEPRRSVEPPATLNFTVPPAAAPEVIEEPQRPTTPLRSESIFGTAEASSARSIPNTAVAVDPAAAAVEAAMHRPMTAVAPAEEAEPVMPDIDPKALRSLLDQAERMMSQLQTGIEEARGTTEEPGRLAEELQERLRVGARMLKAFQSQIDRVETTIGEAEARAEAAAAFEAAKDEALEAVAIARKAETTRVKKELAAALDAARTAIDERARRRDRPAVEVEQIVAQVEKHIEAAMRRIDTHVSDRMPDVPSQESIDLRVERSVQAATGRFDRHAAQVRGELETQAEAAGQLRGQIAATSERVEATELKADELSARVDETARAMKTEVEEARALARRCLDVRSGLASELRKVVSGMEDVAGRGERMRIDVEEQLDRFEQLRDQVTESLSNLEAVVRRVDRVEGTVDRLERLADRLAPWEELLCSGEVTADGLPKPAAELVDRLQSGIGRDVDSLSRTMQEMAERMAGIAGGRRPVSSTRTAGTTGKLVKTTKPAQTTEARPGGLDLPVPNRPNKSEVLSAIEADRRRTSPDAGSPTADADGSRMHLRRTGTS